MTRQRERLSLLLVVLTGLLAGHSPVAVAGETGLVEDPNEWRWDLTERFAIKLDSVQLTSRCGTIDVGESIDCQQPERTLTLSLRFDIADANKPVAVDTNPPVILGVFDDLGQSVDCQIASSDGVRRYEEVRWEYVWVNEDIGNGDRLLPSGLTIDLVLDPNQPAPSSLSRVEGYVYVLYAEEITEADVAFAVDAEWIDAEGDLRISVCPQTPPTPGPIQYEAIPGIPRGAGSSRPTAPVALWKYETRVYSASGDVLPLDGAWVSGPSIDDYVLIKTELIEVKESVTFIREVSGQWNSFGNRDDCFCSGQVEQSHCDYDSIRHVIAVHPVEVKVPFVLTNIPVPAF